VQPLSSRARLGSALRQLGHDVVGHEADDHVLDALTASLREASRQVAAGHALAREKLGFHEHWEARLAEDEPVISWENRPISGTSSPWGLEPDVRRHGDGIIARVTFGSAHEGAPERCHGGIVAAFFDDVLGSVLHVIGEGAFTGELTIRYDAPVPLHRELVCICRLDRREGRKLFMSGELTDDGRLVTSARAVFIQPRTADAQSTFDPA